MRGDARVSMSRVRVLDCLTVAGPPDAAVLLDGLPDLAAEVALAVHRRLDPPPRVAAAVFAAVGLQPVRDHRCPRDPVAALLVPAQPPHRLEGGATRAEVVAGGVARRPLGGPGPPPRAARAAERGRPVWPRLLAGCRLAVDVAPATPPLPLVAIPLVAAEGSRGLERPGAALALVAAVSVLHQRLRVPRPEPPGARSAERGRPLRARPLPEGLLRVDVAPAAPPGPAVAESAVAAQRGRGLERPAAGVTGEGPVPVLFEGLRVPGPVATAARAAAAATRVQQLQNKE